MVNDCMCRSGPTFSSSFLGPEDVPEARAPSSEAPSVAGGCALLPAPAAGGSVLSPAAIALLGSMGPGEAAGAATAVPADAGAVPPDEGTGAAS